MYIASSCIRVTSLQNSRGASLQVNKISTDNDASALSLACAHGHWEIVRLLLDHGADPSHVFKVRFKKQLNLRADGPHQFINENYAFAKYND